MLNGYIAVSPLYQHSVVPGEGVYLLSEFDSIRLIGGINEDIFSFFDVSSDPHLLSVDSLADQLSSNWSYSEIYFAIRQLIAKKYLLNTERILSKEQYFGLAYAALLGRDDLINSQEMLSVNIDGDGIEAELLSSKLSIAGIAIEAKSISNQLRIKIVSDLLNSDIEPFISESFDAGIPCMLLQPKGMRPLIGPIFKKTETACWHCLAQRYSRNREVETYISGVSSQNFELYTSRAYTPGSLDLALSFAATKINDFLRYSDSSLLGKILALNLARTEIAEHPVIKCN
jgi:oxazoline/thiazoline synthase